MTPLAHRVTRSVEASIACGPLRPNAEMSTQLSSGCDVAKSADVKEMVDSLLTRLRQNGGIDRAIVVVSTMFESLENQLAN